MKKSAAIKFAIETIFNNPRISVDTMIEVNTALLDVLDDVKAEETLDEILSDLHTAMEEIEELLK